jgi:acetate---CoA ligase (ADP-forming)
MRDVAPLVRPSTVAIVGASAKRRSQGNGVIQNLQRVGFNGRIIPVHASAPEIEGLPTAPAIEALSPEVDCAVIAIPAPAVAPALQQLDRAGVRSAMVFTNGFSAEEEAAFRRLSDASAMVVHGPNCMGLINFSNGVPLYPSTITAKAKTGKLALIAQSGSAAISLMNSTAAGFSKVVTMGSEFQVTAPDYMRWFAGDDETEVIGVVLEAIQQPEEFAAAAAAIRAAGKHLVVLKVGRSEVGALAVHAHTGAMISRQDAYDCFFAQHGIPTVRDYDELIASMECFCTCGGIATGSRLGIVGISGGETALACDLAADLGISVAEWSAETAHRVRAALPGAAGRNPLDLGSTVHHDVPEDFEAIQAILDDPGVDALLIVQDTQDSLTDTMRGNYTPRILEYGNLGKKTPKPVVLVSPTGENAHPVLLEQLAGSGVAMLRGLRPGLVALRNLGVRAAPAPQATRQRRPAAAVIERETGAQPGPLPAEFCGRILREYDIPLARSAIAASAEEAVRHAGEIGFPLVVKIASRDIAHRSDVGGVVRGVHDAASLRDAIARIQRNVQAAAPKARIDGFELQQELVDHVEALVGFIAAPPFGALMTVGAGGVMVELNADRALRLAPVTPAEAAEMIGATRLGQLLGGYRNLIPRTDTAALARLLANLSALAADLCATIAECDLNPVLIRKGTGEATVVDSLLIARRR